MIALVAQAFHYRFDGRTADGPEKDDANAEYDIVTESADFVSQ
jgi:hypothetical protein